MRAPLNKTEALIDGFSRRELFERLTRGSLVVGFSLVAGELVTSKVAGQVGAAISASALSVDSWITINADSTINVFSGKVELGTGVQTALMQIVAEELYLQVPQIIWVQGDTSLTPGDKSYTAGSKTIQNQGPPLRHAAATALQSLLGLASQQLGAPMNDLVAQDGYIGIGAQLGQKLSFGALVTNQQIQLITNTAVAVKNPANYTVVGTSLPRVDIPAKFNGSFAYVQDIEVPGMLHGRVIHPASRNSTFASLDSASVAAVQAVPGFLQIVQQGNFVGLVATNEWAAIKAAQTLKVNWTNFGPLPFGPNAPPLTATLTNPANIYQTDKEDVAGDVASALADPSATATLHSQYFTPFHMHGAMAPSCSVASFSPVPDQSGIQATIWSGTQGVYPLQGAIAQLLSIPTAAVHVIYVEAAGCYGHNGADDASADAVLLSKAVGQPVRVQWMRQDEHGWEPLGPAMVHNMNGALQGSDLLAWEHNVYTPTHGTRPGNAAGNLLAGQQLGFLPSPLPNDPTNQGTRNGPVTYEFPNKQLVANQVKIFNTGPLSASGAPAVAPLTSILPRSSALRSLGGFSNSFANESFMDELAVAAGVDPVAFRLRYLPDVRASAVIQAMAQQANLTASLPPGPVGTVSGRGIAFQRYEVVETYVAACVELQVNTTTGVINVTRVVVAHDCGLIINPDGLRNQIEGNVMQGISRTLFEQVAFNANGVTSVLWANSSFSPNPVAYPVLNFKDVPASVEIVLLDQPTQISWGAGEAALGVMPGAIGNAFFNATGCRMRTLPLTAASVLAALA